MDPSYAAAIDLSNQDRYAEAAHALRILVVQGTDAPIIHYDYARAAFMAGRFGEAIAFYLSEQPSPPATYWRSVVCAGLEQLRDAHWRALSHIASGRKANRGDGLLDLVEGKVRAALGQIQHAAELLLHATSYAPLRWSALANTTFLDHMPAETLSALEHAARKALEGNWPADLACGEARNRAHMLFWLAARTASSGTSHIARRILTLFDDHAAGPAVSLYRAATAVVVGDFELAASLFEQGTSVLRTWPSVVWDLHRVGEALGRVAARFSDNVVLQCRYTEYLSCTGNHELALALARTTLERNTEHALAAITHVDVLSRAGRADQAIDHMIRWIHATQGDSEHHEHLADLLTGNGKLGGAAVLLRRAGIHPPEPLQLMYEGFWAISQRDYGIASDCLERAIALGLNRPEAIDVLARCLAQRAPVRARKMFARKWEADPNDVRACSGMLSCSVRLNDVETAQEMFKRILALVPEGVLNVTAEETEFLARLARRVEVDEGFQLGVARCLAENGRINDALAVVEALGSSNADACFQHGRFLQVLGQQNAARKAYRAALLCNPLHAAAMSALGITLADAGELGEARELLLEAISLNSEDRECNDILRALLCRLGEFDLAARLRATLGVRFAPFGEEWIHYVRQFITSGDTAHLAAAADACRDGDVVSFLKRADLAGPAVPVEAFRCIVSRLNSEGRSVEADVIELAALRAAALLPGFGEPRYAELGADIISIGANLVRLCHIHGFVECEALFATHLGVQLVGMKRTAEASRVLARAVDRYYFLLAIDEGRYMPLLGQALSHLGIALEEQNDLGPAECALAKALTVRRKLAQAGSHESQSQLANTLLSLGAVLRRLGQFSRAHELLREALQVVRRLAVGQEVSAQGPIAAVLNAVGNLLVDEGRFREARTSLSEASEIYRTLAAHDPDRYRADLAHSLSNLGSALRELLDFLPARAALEEAVQIYRSLVDAGDERHRPDTAMALNNLGAVLGQERRYAEACGMLEEARDLYRSLAGVDIRAYGIWLAATQQNLGSVLREARRFGDSRSSLEEAVAILKRLSFDEPGCHAPVLALALTNLGSLLAEQNKLEEAVHALSDAVTAYRQLVAQRGAAYKSPLARALTNLSGILGRAQKPAEGRKHAHEAVRIYRELVTSEPKAYRSLLAGSLNNLGGLLHDITEFTGAARAFEEAADIYRHLVAVEPSTYLLPFVSIFNNLQDIFAELGDNQKALAAAREGIAAAEQVSDDPGERYLAKGRVTGAYIRLVHHAARTRCCGDLFRYVSALREGPVTAAESTCECLDAATRALREAEDRIGRRISILIAQSLGRRNVLLGILGAGGLKYCRAPEFAGPAQELQAEIVAMFEHRRSGHARIKHEKLKRQASLAWGKLPRFVRGAISPGNGHDVLISGDAFWNQFAWEGLRFGSGEDEWLGLYRPLARWQPLSSKMFERLARKPFGEGRRTATVFCPWDVPGANELRGSRYEAERVLGHLKAANYCVLPVGVTTIGIMANVGNFVTALMQRPSLIHFTGHGTVLDNEEMLVLHEDRARADPPAFWGRRELAELRAQSEFCSGVLSHGPLVVLNACYAARVHGFGGQREDLAWTFLADGAEAVVGSFMPIADKMGALFGDLLYQAAFHEGNGMAEAFAVVRGLCERCFREKGSAYWAAWTLLTYHGNPYVRLPHVFKTADDSTGAPTVARLTNSLLSILGLRTATAAESVLNGIRGRLK